MHSSHDLCMNLYFSSRSYHFSSHAFRHSWPHNLAFGSVAECTTHEQTSLWHSNTYTQKRTHTHTQDSCRRRSRGSRRGNYALMDIIAALHWVHDNICWNGRRCLVTSRSWVTIGELPIANLLMISPMARGKEREYHALWNVCVCASEMCFEQRLLSIYPTLVRPFSCQLSNSLSLLLYFLYQYICLSNFAALLNPSSLVPPVLPVSSATCVQAVVLIAKYGD